MSAHNSRAKASLNENNRTFGTLAVRAICCEVQVKIIRTPSIAVRKVSTKTVCLEDATCHEILHNLANTVNRELIVVWPFTKVV